MRKGDAHTDGDSSIVPAGRTCRYHSPSRRLANCAEKLDWLLSTPMNLQHRVHIWIRREGVVRHALIAVVRSKRATRAGPLRTAHSGAAPH